MLLYKKVKYSNYITDFYDIELIFSFWNDALVKRVYLRCESAKTTGVRHKVSNYAYFLCDYTVSIVLFILYR